MNTQDDHELDNEPGAIRPGAPQKLGVYDRPERRGISPALLILLVILALIIAYVVWQAVS